MPITCRTRLGHARGCVLLGESPTGEGRGALLLAHLTPATGPKPTSPPALTCRITPIVESRHPVPVLSLVNSSAHAGRTIAMTTHHSLGTALTPALLRILQRHERGFGADRCRSWAVPKRRWCEGK